MAENANQETTKKETYKKMYISVPKYSASGKVNYYAIKPKGEKIWTSYKVTLKRTKLEEVRIEVTNEPKEFSNGQCSIYVTPNQKVHLETRIFGAGEYNKETKMAEDKVIYSKVTVDELVSMIQNPKLGFNKVKISEWKEYDKKEYKPSDFKSSETDKLEASEKNKFCQ